MLSFKESNGLEIVEGDVDHLAISEEVSDDGTLNYPVLVFTPDMGKVTECFHIELYKHEAQKLHDWLGEFLKKS